MKMIVGYENEKKEILGLKNMLLKAEEYKACGIRIPRGLVLYGVPGVGKTQLARSCSGDKITFIELRAASCCEDNAADAIREVFETAKEKQPSVILLDELDKIAGTSDRFYMEGNCDIQKMLLQELDALTDDENILVIATCNSTEVLGDALLRPGRFDRQINVEIPDEDTREKILKAYFNKLKLRKNLDLRYVSKLIPGHTGAQIECLVNEVGIRALENGKKSVGLPDVVAVMNKLAFNGAEKPQPKDEARLKMIATHEAGHALVAMTLLPDSIYGASILPQGDSYGHIYFANPESGVFTVGELENEVAVLIAGHVAERVVLGEYLIDAGDDLAKAESRLRFLTTSQGAYGYESIIGSSSMRFDMINADITKNEYCRIIAEKLNIFDSKVEDIIRNNRDVFDKIVNELMANQTLTREELISIKTEYLIMDEAA